MKKIILSLAMMAISAGYVICVEAGENLKETDKSYFSSWKKKGGYIISLLAHTTHHLSVIG